MFPYGKCSLTGAYKCSIGSGWGHIHDLVSSRLGGVFKNALFVFGRFTNNGTFLTSPTVNVIDVVVNLGRVFSSSRTGIAVYPQSTTRLFLPSFNE